MSSTDMAGATRGRDERGATMVLFALCLVMLMSVIALAIDTGSAFSSHRQTRNAADAASLAGADLVKQYINGTAVTPANVATEVLNKTGASQNATNRAPSCYFVSQDYPNPAKAGYHLVLDSSGNLQTLASAYDFCTNPGSFTTIPSTADGVLVVAAHKSNTVFAQAAGGPKSLSLSGIAAALVESVNPGSGTSAIMMCAVGNNDANANGDGMTNPLLIHQTPSDPSTPYVLDPTRAWPVNTNPFTVRDPSAPGCGLGSSFKGWVAGAKGARKGGACGPTGYTNCSTFSFGPTSQWQSENGDLGASTDTMIQETSTNGPSCSLTQPASTPPTQAQINALCQQQIPLCYAYSGGGALSCIGYAVIAIYSAPSSTYSGYLLSSSLVVPPGSYGGQPAKGASSTVALVQ